MSETIVLFEDDAASTLEPLSLTRPVWDLRCGIRSLSEKIVNVFPCTQIYQFARDWLGARIIAPLPPELKNSSDLLWINGSLLPGASLEDAAALPCGSAWLREGRIIAWRGTAPPNWQPGTQLPLASFTIIDAPPEAGKLLRYFWHFVSSMNAENEREAALLRPLGQMAGELHPSAVLVKPAKICIAAGSHVNAGAVLDATRGAIVLDEAVVIGANAVIEGPTFIGAHTQLKSLAHVIGSSLGVECRVGGEVSCSIIQGYSNKQHGGFLGHSYIGSWCNLGSGTETSNLKNNYSPVRVQIGKELVDSGELFVGLCMGDHSKSAIGTVFNTGTVVGVASNVFGAGFPPRLIPSFAWGGAEKLTSYHLNKTLEIARSVEARRGVELDETEIQILTWIKQHRL